MSFMEGAESIRIRPAEGGSILAVKAVAGSSRDKVSGVLGDALKVTTSSAAEKGKANAALARTLARALGLSRKDVRIAAGATNPQKEFHVAGLSPADLRRRLAEL